MRTLLDEDDDVVTVEVTRIPEVVEAQPSTPQLPPDVLELEAIKGVTITSNETRRQVAEALAEAATRRKRRRELMDAELEPFKLQIQAIETKRNAKAEPHKVVIGALLQLEQYFEQTLRTYDVAEMRRAAEEQRKKNEQIEARNEREIQKAEEKGVAPKLVAPSIVPAPVKQVETVMGSVNRTRVRVCTIPGLLPSDTTKAIRTYDIPADDPRIKDVPREFLVLNWSKIVKMRSAGATIPGLLNTEDLDYQHRRAK